MISLLNASIIALFLSLSLYSHANHTIAIIVHPENHNEFDERVTRQIFLGQIKSFPDGKEAKAFAVAGNEALRDDFITKVLRRNPHTMNAYWARMIFTAKATPPRELPSADAIKKMVANSPNAIGYINSSDIDNSVRVIAIIE